MIRLIALLILGTALASCASGTHKIVDMIERSRWRGIEVAAAKTGAVGSMMMAINTIATHPRDDIAWGFSAIQSHWFGLWARRSLSGF